MFSSFITSARRTFHTKYERPSHPLRIVIIKGELKLVERTLLGSPKARTLFRLRKSHTIFPEIINRVISPQKRISDDPNGPKWGRNIQSLETGNTCSLSVHDVVGGGEGEVVTGEGEGNVGERRDFVAVNCVGSVPGLFGADFFVQKLLLATA